ncbi:TGACG-sequence-specific DNA-binding protein TGA-1A-like [Nicotiana tomentosiformis]|uniref:TGACG-sequence-specific DNA-binding protein TGA-1A-like n=1 Tax=Nicotiana tomentosiformis TaxID=4098 RepID=UPI00051B30C8|nr:TGACG-sequence-specific DNA-binding protein TGA-1A-like [Nicotiana tomentosiformis]XP_016496331.1 PREDICTED: TGACG-sequence-specific DNA-binding protein TGA-1A-like [Nicotiana tabacum]
MNSTYTQFVASKRMGICDPIHQIGMWGDFKNSSFPDTSATLILEVENCLENEMPIMEKRPHNETEELSHGTVGTSNRYEPEARKPIDKVLRRLAQNREAARKSRLRKKAYVQQLENSKLKLLQLEQELERTRQQGQYAGVGLDESQIGYTGTANSGIVAFEMEYGHWVEEQDRQTDELRSALNSQVGEIELQLLVEGCLNHYFDLFRMKAAAAHADVLFLMTGTWKTSAERFFLWIAGFRPSELLKVLTPNVEPLTEQQLRDVCNLMQSCQQAEDALSQGMVKLHQILAEAVAAGTLGDGIILPKMAATIENLEALVRFVNQADHLRQETLLQMSCILTPQQSAQGLLALGEYFKRLRALSSLWTSRTSEPA